MDTKRTSLLVYFTIIFIINLVRCEVITNNLNQTGEVTGEGQVPCKDLIGCVRFGVISGLGEIENSEVYPLFGRRLILEKTLTDGEHKDLSKMGIIQRANHLLDTHVVRAPLTRSLALKLFRTQQGNFDVALEVSAPSAVRDGRTFFKHRIQMAMLPIMYKMGVMTTLLGALVVMVMKGLVIGVILLILAVSSAVKHKLHYSGEQHGWSQPSGPYILPSHQPAPQDIHVHLHGIGKETLVHKEDHHVHQTSAIGGGYSQHYPAATSGGESYLSPYNRQAHLTT